MATLLDYAVGNARTGLERINPQFAEGLQGFFAANPGLTMYSGYRSIERQRELWEASDKSGRMVARPGHSRHNFGEAADLQFNGVRLDKLKQDQITALHQSAANFGLEFPMSWEPWHVQRAKGQAPQQQPNAQPETLANASPQMPMPGLNDQASHQPLGALGQDLLSGPSTRQQSQDDWLRNTSYSSDAILADFFAQRNPLKRWAFQQAASMFS